METAYAVLLVLVVIYVIIYAWVWKNKERAERWHLVRYGPCLMIKTRLGMKTMDRLAKHTRLWRAFGLASKLVSAILFFLIMYMLVVSIISLPSTMSSPAVGIEYALAIPGFNPILPLSYGVVALFVAMVVHELGHGIQARANSVKVDSTGLLYAVVPVGAFVEPNEEEIQKQSRRVKMDVYTAGITVNTVVALVSILLLAGACGLVSSEYSDNAGIYSVDSGSPVLDADIPVSAIITGVRESGTEVWDDTATVVEGSVTSIDYGFDPTRTYDIQYLFHGETFVAEGVQMGSYIKSVVVGSPADQAGMTAGEFVASLQIEGQDPVVIGNPHDFTMFMEGTQPGQTVTVTAVTDMDDAGQYAIKQYTLTLGDNSGIGYVGITSTTGGITFTTPDVLLSTASNPFRNATDPFSYVTSFLGYLSGPFNGMDPISDEVKWWYDVPMGDLFWVILSLLYWIFWLDILLGISNALPAYPFDGGFIFAGGVNWLLEKLRIGDEARRERMTENISSSVSSLVLFMFVLVVLAMVI